MKTRSVITWKSGQTVFKAECLAQHGNSFWLRLIEPERVRDQYVTQKVDDMQKAQTLLLPDALEDGLSLVEFDPVADMRVNQPGDGHEISSDEVAVLLQVFQ